MVSVASWAYGTVFILGVVHTLFGPDHYVPFIALAKARGWTVRSSVALTLLCGLGHIATAVGLSLVAVRFASFVSSLETVENFRAAAAAWALTGFGFAYAVWGVRRAVKKAPEFTNPNDSGEPCPKGAAMPGKTVSALLFAIFALGPCEPLIPILVAFSAGGSPVQAAYSALTFGAATLVTMAAVVGVSLGALGRFRFPKALSRFGHPIAGALMGTCGLSMLFLGL